MAQVLEILKFVQAKNNHEVQIRDRAIVVKYDDDSFATQPWIVKINNQEVHRANTLVKAESWVQWHYKNGTLPVVEAERAVVCEVVEKIQNQGFIIEEQEVEKDVVHITVKRLGFFEYWLQIRVCDRLHIQIVLFCFNKTISSWSIPLDLLPSVLKNIIELIGGLQLVTDFARSA